MKRARWLLGVGLLGCHPVAEPSSPSTPPLSPAGALPRASASVVPVASAPGAPPAPADPKQDAQSLLVEAARSDLLVPPPGEETLRQYVSAAILLGAKRRVVRDRPAFDVVRAGLIAADSSAAREALVSWLSNDQAMLDNRVRVLADLADSPRAEYLPAFKAVLDDPAFAARITTTRAPASLLSRVLPGIFFKKCSAYCEALGALKRLQLPEADELIRSVATDRARSGPNPKTLAALSCEEGHRVVPEVAAALASERLWALSILGDLELVQSTALDPTEPKLVRSWCQRVIDARRFPLPAAKMLADEPPPPAPCRRGH